MPEINTNTNRFPNVKLDPNFRRSPNPFTSSASLPGQTFCQSQNTTSQHHKNDADLPQQPNYNVPSMVDLPKSTTYYSETPPDFHSGLPPLNHDHDLKRAKI
jgi:hypothetical protein